MNYYSRFIVDMIRLPKYLEYPSGIEQQLRQYLVPLSNLVEIRRHYEDKNRHHECKPLRGSKH